ncbi:MAG: SufD family Fe-S cluster assembly protein, partial [Solirubrobacterales bacterium]|nr:SufD family Fe-S cluster assembly protein [Solirubrobacterales bacterium]
MASAAPAGVGVPAELELPTFKGRPGWEFTDISGLDLAAYERVGGEADGAAGVEALWSIPEAGGLPEGVIVGALDDPEHQELVQRHLGSLVSDDDVFVALNDAGVRAGAFVFVPRNVVLEEPISLTSVQARTGTLLNQRTLVVLEEGAQAEVWEQFLSGSGDLDGVFNTVTELVVGQGGRLRYVCGQGLSEKSWIFGAQRAEVGRDAALDWVALGFGSARGHVRMETRLVGEGAEARVTGAYASH